MSGVTSTLNRATSWLESYAAGSAPSDRTIYTAYALIENDHGEDVGSFVLGLYQLAKEPGGLRNQRFEQDFVAKKQAQNADYKFHPQDLLDVEDPILKELVKNYNNEDADLRKGFITNKDPNARDMLRTLTKIKKSLYHDDDSPLSPFEMALVRTHNRTEIERIIKKEYAWQQVHGLLPQEIYKLLLGEWLGRIGEKGYKIKEVKEGSALKGATITLDNFKPKGKEEVLHFVMQLVATFTTLSSVILTIAALTSPLVAVLLGLATWMAFESANNFQTFDMGEWFWKDVRWSTTKNFLSTKKWSGPNTIKSLLFFSAIGFMAFTGAQAMFAAALAFPLFGAMPTAVVQGFAYTAAAWSFVTSMVGLSIPIRYLRGLGFHDNQVDPSEIPDDLPPIDKHDVTRPKQKLRALKEELERNYNVKVEFGAGEHPNVIQFRDLSSESSSDDAYEETLRSTQRNIKKL